jgi:hypothetical protein
VSPFLIAIAILAIALGARLLVQDGRRRLLTEIRANWGKPGNHRHKLDTIAAASRSRFAAFHEEPSVDNRTWVDLDLDDVFAAIDRTASTLGQHALYHRLHTAPASEDRKAFEALVARMSDDVSARERAQMALARLQDTHGYDVWWLARANAVEHRDWYAIIPLLTISTVTIAALAIRWHVLVPWLIGLLVTDLFVRFVAADRIGALGGSLRQIAPIVVTGEALAFLQGDDIAPIVGTLPSDVARLRRLKTVARWLSGEPFLASVTPGGMAELATLVVRAVYEYVNLLLLLDANGLYFGISDVRAHSGCLVRLTASIGDVDAAMSVASWRQERADWTRPRFVAPESPAVLRDLRHPLVDEAVPNSLGLEPGRGILVTGSNMSGKSTFLKAVGVNAVLAQTLNTCLATTYQAPIFCVQSCIGRADDLIAGKSYYIVEVEQVLARVHSSAETAPHLFLFDELFRGTNAVERIAAAEAVLRELLEDSGSPKPHAVLAATHDAELVDLLNDSYSAYHFTDTLGPQGLVFEYRLAPGPSKTRNAITLLELFGAPASVMRRALTRAAALDRQRENRPNQDHNRPLGLA